MLKPTASFKFGSTRPGFNLHHQIHQDDIIINQKKRLIFHDCTLVTSNASSPRIPFFSEVFQPFVVIKVDQLLTAQCFPQYLQPSGARSLKTWDEKHAKMPLPIGFIYGIFTYIWLIWRVNVGEFTIHGYYGL